AVRSVGACLRSHHPHPHPHTHTHTISHVSCCWISPWHLFYIPPLQQFLLINTFYAGMSAICWCTRLHTVKYFVSFICHFIYYMLCYICAYIMLYMCIYYAMYVLVTALGV